MNSIKFIAGLFLIAISLAANASSQDGGSTLMRAAKSDLIVYGSVVGKSNVSNMCNPMEAVRCQRIIFKVHEVIKGNFKPEYIWVVFVFADFDKYVQTLSSGYELSPFFFDKEKRWIFILDSKRILKNCLFIPSDVKQFAKTQCISGSLSASIPANDPEELTLMKEFISSLKTSR